MLVCSWVRVWVLLLVVVRDVVVVLSWFIVIWLMLVGRYVFS